MKNGITDTMIFKKQKGVPYLILTGNNQVVMDCFEKQLFFQ